MTFDFNLSHLILALVALVSGVWAAAKYIAMLQERAVLQGQEFFTQQFASHEKAEFDFHARLSLRLDSIEALHREDMAQWQRVERELLMLKADMPLNYVRRDDYVQAIASILVKLDSATLRHENLLLKGLRP